MANQKEMNELELGATLKRTVEELFCKMHPEASYLIHQDPYTRGEDEDVEMRKAYRIRLIREITDMVDHMPMADIIERQNECAEDLLAGTIDESKEFYDHLAEEEEKKIKQAKQDQPADDKEEGKCAISAWHLSKIAEDQGLYNIIHDAIAEAVSNPTGPIRTMGLDTFMTLKQDWKNETYTVPFIGTVKIVIEADDLLNVILPNMTTLFETKLEVNTSNGVDPLTFFKAMVAVYRQHYLLPYEVENMFRLSTLHYRLEQVASCKELYDRLYDAIKNTMLSDLSEELLKNDKYFSEETKIVTLKIGSVKNPITAVIGILPDDSKVYQKALMSEIIPNWHIAMTQNIALERLACYYCEAHNSEDIVRFTCHADKLKDTPTITLDELAKNKKKFDDVLKHIDSYARVNDEMIQYGDAFNTVIFTSTTFWGKIYVNSQHSDRDIIECVMDHAAKCNGFQQDILNALVSIYYFNHRNEIADAAKEENGN